MATFLFVYIYTKCRNKNKEAYPKDIRPQLSESNPEQANMEYLQTRVLYTYSYRFNLP